MLTKQDDDSKEENEDTLESIEKSMRISRKIFQNLGENFPDPQNSCSSVLFGGFKKT